jgi:hypothetical protein
VPEVHGSVELCRRRLLRSERERLCGISPVARSHSLEENELVHEVDVRTMEKPENREGKMCEINREIQFELSKITSGDARAV